MLRYTDTQVKEQQKQFDCFMKAANLSKIGAKYFKFTVEGEQGKSFNYINRVLRIVAKVQPAMYHPENMHFYNELLREFAIRAYIDSIPSKN